MFGNDFWHAANDLISRLEVIVAVAVILFGWTLRVAVPVKRAADRLCSGLSGLRRVLKGVGSPGEVAERYEELHERLSANPVLGDIWLALDATLAKPKEPGRPIRQTTEATRFFNASLMRHCGADMRTAQTHANTLVGAGLLLTFIGLIFALNAAGTSLSEQDPDKVRAGLKQLLAASAMKFSFSVIGLLLSLGFAARLRRQLRQIDREIDALTDQLMTSFPPLAPQDVALEGNELLNRMLAAQQTFLTDLSHNIDQSLGRRLAEQIDPLRAAIDKLAASMATMNQSALDQMLRQFIEKLEGAAGAQIKDLTTGLAQIAGELAIVMDGLRKVPADLGRAGEAAGDTLKNVVTDAAAEFARSIGAAAEKLQDSAAATDQAMRNAAIAFGDKTEAAARLLSTSLSDFRDGLAAVDQRVRETATAVQAAQQALAQTTIALEGAATGLSDASRDMRDSGGALREILGELNTAALALQKTADAQQRLEGQAEFLARSLGETAARFNSVDEKIGRTVEELTRGLLAFQQRIQSFVAETDRGMADVTRKLMAEIDRLAEELEAFNDSPAGKAIK